VGKIFRIAAWVLGAVVILVAALFMYLRGADLTVYEEHIERFASNAIGHKLDIDGRFKLQFGRHSRLVAENVSLRNPNWPSEPGLLRVGHVTVVVDTWTLLDRPLVVENLEVRDIDGRLELLADGRSNWDTGREPEPAGDDFDTNRVAFRRVRIDDVDFSFHDPERARSMDIVIEGLTVTPDGNDILDLDFQGTINGMPLWAEGKLGPWPNFLDGKDISADLDLTLGTLRLSVTGLAADLPYLQGIVAEAVLTGPDAGRVIGRLGLPPLADGPFEIRAEIANLEDSHRVRVEGNLGAIDVLASGRIDRFIAAQSAELDISIAGPDFEHVAKLFGIDGAPAAAFRLAGELTLDGVEVGLRGTRLSIGSNSVTVNGNLDFSPAVPDLALTIAAEGPDFSVIGPFLGRQDIPPQLFAINGEVRKEGALWQAQSVEAVIGANRITADGSLRAGSRDDSQISFRAVGPDLSSLQGLTGLHGLPAEPFDVTALLRSNPEGVSVDEVVGVFGGNRLEAEGILTDRSGLQGTTLRLHVVGTELANLALLTGIPHLPAGPFDVSGELRFDDEWFVFDEAAATFGDLSATASGRVGLAGQDGEFAVTFTLNGPDAAQFQALPWLAPFSGEPFAIAGGIEGAGAAIELTNVSLEIGQLRLSADGTLSLSPMSNDSNLAFSAAGPNLQRVGQMFGSDMLAVRDFEVSGEVTGTPGGFTMRNFNARVGKDDINGEFTADLRYKPHVSGRLTSTFLDLSERLQPPLDPKGPPRQSSAAERGLIFSDRPIDGKLLGAADIDLEMQVARLRTNTLDVTDFVLAVRLFDGDLRIDPISMTQGAGSFAGRVHFSPVAGGYLLETTLEADNLHIGLAASEDQRASTLPPVSGKISLRGSGASLHEIVASANGRVAVRQGKGQVKEFISAMLFRDVVLEALRTINPLRRKETTRSLDCGIYEISLVEGIATLDQVAIQTNQLLFVATGSLDLNTENLNVNFRAKPREGLGVSLGTLANSFLGVRGTLASPRVSIDPKGSVTTTGAAVATGGLSLLARGVWDRLSAARNICEEKSDAKRGAAQN
jgi:uncharacterized protein involved in outer membrane biogenesis